MQQSDTDGIGCTYCRRCDEACPKALETGRLISLITLVGTPSNWSTTQAERLDDLQASELDQCDDCGACTLVCPSRLALDSILQTGKALLAAESEERNSSSYWRHRFERRQLRVAKARLEKRVRPNAEKHVTKIATAKPDSTGFSRASAQQDIAAAVARVKAKRASLTTSDRVGEKK